MMSFAYDAVGNRIQRTDYNNMTTSYAYDELHRLTTITYPDASTTTYSYDALSQLKTATNLNGTVSFVYDSLGRATSTTDVWGQVINYTYDANDRRTKMSFATTTKATYTYDAVNHLTKITDGSNLATSYVYDAANKLTSRTLPNSVATIYTYDGLDRLTRLKDAKNNTVIADNNYTYNAAGQITQNIDQSGTHAYGYDALDRLTSATYTGTPAESYAYDSVGNRTSSQRSATYSYQPFNRLTNTTTASYVYNNNGNLISKTEGAGTTQFQWNFENRLIQVVTPASGSVTYKYDALGRRIQSAPSNGVSTNFTYDGNDVAQDKTSTNVITEYLNGPGIDNKIHLKTGSTLYYFAQDHLGSTTALTDSKGALVERQSYDAYGNSSGSTRTRYGYTGRERDSLTRVQYNRARFYDPQLGRFISEDPIGLAGGINSFAYVGNNPVLYRDPSGLCPQNSAPRPDLPDWVGDFYKKHQGQIDRCINRVFGQLSNGTPDLAAMVMARQTIKNAPELNVTTPQGVLYLYTNEPNTQGTFFLASNLGYGTVYIAQELYTAISQDERNRTYFHELGNILSAQITGDARHFGDPNGIGIHYKDPDTGARLEKCIFGSVPF